MPTKYHVLLISSHPVQYAAPLFREMAKDASLDVQVAYCSLQGAHSGIDPEFGVDVKWDIPLLEGYAWAHVRNCSPQPRLGSFFGLVNPGLWKLVVSERFDAVIVYTGYIYLSFWIALAAAKLSSKAILFGTDAHQLASRGRERWKTVAKRLLWPLLFRLADVVIVPSSRSAELMRSLGIPEERIRITPFVVDNKWWTVKAAAADRDATRRDWQVPSTAPVILFCAKLQQWKRPQDVLRAFAQAQLPGSYLIYAGDGPLRSHLEAEAAKLGVCDRVRFLGFINQSQLPSIYRASDLMVLPSEYEPFGLVVNEAMVCGCVPAVSDQVGAGYDLISSGENGYRFPSCDPEELAVLVRSVFKDPVRLASARQAAIARMQTWSFREHIQSLVLAIERAVSLRASR